MWEWVIPSSELNAAKQRYLLSSTARRSDGVHVRVLVPTGPNGAQRVPATLEDAYLYSLTTRRSGGMNYSRVLYHLVKADFLERVRRYSFLLTLGFAFYLAYAAGTGKIVLRLDNYQGVLNSAWCGSMMTLVSTCFLTLVGFYIVKNALLRDEQTRVGQILAATPMTRTFYTLAKTLSNFVVLASMLAVLALAAVILQLASGQHFPLQPLTLLAPFVWVGLPAMAMTAAVAVLFETLPVLRGGIGNVIYFFLWGITLGMAADRQMDDAIGFTVIGRNMQGVLHGLDAAYKNDLSLTIANNVALTRNFVWNGVDWTAAVILHRLLWVAAAAGTAIVAAAFFHRFDPASEYFWRKRRPGTAAAGNGNGDVQTSPLMSADAPSVHLTPIARTPGQSRFLHLAVSELRLMLKGQRWWWYAAATGLLVAELASPTADARSGVLLAAWLWPILIWSQMGCRESRYATQSLIFSSPRALYRQLAAVWVAGLAVAVLTGSGIVIRFMLSGDWHRVLDWSAGALFIPSLALALGEWSGTRKPFEAIYTVWWYMGPLHRMPGGDFMGITAESSRTATYVLAAIILLAVSYLGRRMRFAYASTAW